MTADTLHLRGVVGRGEADGWSSTELDLAVSPGEVVAVLGPNGAGKSTVLRTMAGLEPLRSGRLTLGGQVLDDASTGDFLAVAERRVAMVFQDHRLFPHLSALGNVAFGPRASGTGRDDAAAVAARWLERLGVRDLADRRPAQLSGGQAQRVAIARALAADPSALVLDEPLAALDVRARGDVQRALAEHLAAFPGPCVLVTHDLVDALVLADRIVILEAGALVQTGTPLEVVRRPATQYVARLLGVNLFAGPTVGEPAGFDVAVRPSAIRLTPVSGEEPGDGHSWTGIVTGIVAWGEHVRVEVAGEPSAVVEIPTSGLGEHIRPGAQVRLSFRRAQVETFPAPPP